MSNKRIVHWQGSLKGNGHEATCTVEALEIEHPAGGPPAYARYSVMDVSKRLPEGVYELETHGERHSVRHVNGAWIAATP